MEHYIAVFKSRSEAFSYANNLTRNGVASQIIQTPKEAGRTCGLAVKIMKDDIFVAREILSKSRALSFVGWLNEINFNGERRIIRG